jgi:hypothetical protein
MKNFIIKILRRLKKDDSEWVNICEINDTDCLIIIYREAFTNNLVIEVNDKDLTKEKLVFRDRFFSFGDPKYAKMPGFTPEDNPDCQIKIDDSEFWDKVKQDQ